MSLSDVWELTPAEVVRLVDAERDRREWMLEASISEAWHTAAMSRSKKLQPLRRYLHQDVEPLTPEQMEQMNDAAARFVTILEGGLDGRS